MAIQWSAAAINPHLVDAVLTAVYNNRLASDEMQHRRLSKIVKVTKAPP
jgi:hypothetical protein